MENETKSSVSINFGPAADAVAETKPMTPEEKKAAGIELTLSEKRSLAGKKGGANRSALYVETRLKNWEYRKKILSVADVLFRESLHNARGRSFLYKIEKELVVGPRGGKKYIAKRPALVTSEVEIEEYLAGIVENGDLENDNDPNSVYYYITTERGDQRAIDSMLDRAFGKATQVVQTEDEDGIRKPIQGNAITFIKQDGD